MNETLLFIVGLIQDFITAFFFELSGLFFSHFIQFMLAGLILVMVNFERKRTSRPEFTYLTLAFMLLMFQEYLMCTVLGLKVITKIIPAEEYSVVLYRVLELFALIILTTAFLYPVAKRKAALQKILLYNLLSAVGISLAVFLSFHLQDRQGSFAVHWGSRLFGVLDLILLITIIVHTLMVGRRSTLLIVAAASFWAFRESCILYNSIVLGGEDQTLLVLSETVPIAVYTLLVLAIYRQITKEYMSLQLATLKSKMRLEAIFDGITDGIMTLDKDLKILNVNQSERRLLDMPTDEMIGKTCFELYGRGSQPCPDCPAKATFLSGEKSSASFHCPRKLGEKPSFFEEEAFPLFNRSGEVDQIIIYIKNTTERHRTQDRIRALDRLAAIGEMSTRVAHE
ncbi:PAS domain-containing protein, partial [bacterium]|nr:PAS domain-containing protein [bacterium]